MNADILELMNTFPLVACNTKKKHTLTRKVLNANDS